MPKQCEKQGEQHGELIDCKESVGIPCKMKVPFGNGAFCKISPLYNGPQKTTGAVGKK